MKKSKYFRKDQKYLSEQRSNLENPGWYPENDIDGIVAPLLNGIRNSLSKASIEKKDVEKYIASFKCGTILHIDQLHDDWNRYISPISSETRIFSVFSNQKRYSGNRLLSSTRITTKFEETTIPDVGLTLTS